MKLFRKNQCITKATAEENQLNFSHKLKTFREESPNIFTLYINDFDDAPNNDDIIDELTKRAPDDYLKICINSHGGLITELQRFHNTISTFFKDRFETEINSIAYSAGAFLFCIAPVRVCFEHSHAMFHNAAGGIFGKFSDMKEQHNFDMEFYQKYLKSIISKFFTEKEIEQLLEGKEFWFDTLEMCKRGICTDVWYDGGIITAKEYIKIKTPAKVTKKHKSAKSTKIVKQKQTKNKTKSTEDVK